MGRGDTKNVDCEQSVFCSKNCEHDIEGKSGEAASALLAHFFFFWGGGRRFPRGFWNNGEPARSVRNTFFFLTNRFM